MDQLKPKLSDTLAQKRTDLAVDRTHFAVERNLMAAERTLMAWIRTGLSMIGFGFTIYKVLQALREEGMQLAPSVQGPRNIGLFLIALGILSAFMGSLEYLTLAKGLRKKYGVTFRKSPVVMSGLIFLLGLLLFIGVLFRLGSF